MMRISNLKVSVDWNLPIENIYGNKIIYHQIINTSGGELHILTIKKLSNPIVYNNRGVCLGQLNFDYICDILYSAYEIRNIQQSAELEEEGDDDEKKMQTPETN